MGGGDFVFEQIRSAGCLSYLLGCARDKICVIIDPELDKADDYVGLADFFGSKLIYAIDTHTHADHHSACKVMREIIILILSGMTLAMMSVFMRDQGIRAGGNMVQNTISLCRQLSALRLRDTTGR